MNTLSEAQYVEAAIANLDECKTDADLIEWDDRNTNNERYINLPTPLVRKLEDAYDKRLRAIVGED